MMSHEEYKKKLQEIKKRCNDKIMCLGKEFILSHTKYKKGKKITWNGRSILIDDYCMYGDELYYLGFILTKKGNLNRCKQRGSIKFGLARKFEE